LYGLSGNRDRLKTRLEKEAVHEFGHAFGLVHCPNPGCRKHTSAYLEEINFKSKDFCNNCSTRLEKKKEDLLKTKKQS